MHAQPQDSRSTVVAQVRRDERRRRSEAPRYVTSPAQAERLAMLLYQLPGSDSNTQCLRVKLALEGGPITTIEIARYLDVLHPAGRIKNLRDAGLDVDTRWVCQETTSGHQHRVAQYTLREEGK